MRLPNNRISYHTAKPGQEHTGYIGKPHFELCVAEDGELQVKYPDNGFKAVESGEKDG